jgi:hypothetical protein
LTMRGCSLMILMPWLAFSSLAPVNRKISMWNYPCPVNAWHKLYYFIDWKEHFYIKRGLFLTGT